jgi:hypothetical protein
MAVRMDNCAINCSRILLKFFPEMSRVRTMVPCCPDGHTSAASNFHIEALHVRTKRRVVRTADLMHAISISDARASGRLDLNYDTCLMDERGQKEIHVVRKVSGIFPYLCFGKKS